VQYHLSIPPEVEVGATADTPCGRHAVALFAFKTGFPRIGRNKENQEPDNVGSDRPLVAALTSLMAAASRDRSTAEEIYLTLCTARNTG
jgi:hypothetical protein